MKSGKIMAKRELLRRRASKQLRVGTIENTVKTLKAGHAISRALS